MEDRGRTIVEYRCDLAGADDFNKVRLAQGMSNIHKITETYKSTLQAELNAGNQALATPSVALEDDATRQLRTQIAGLTSVQTWLQSDNVDVLATNPPEETNHLLYQFLNTYLETKKAGGDTTALVKSILIGRAENIQDVTSQIASANGDIEKEQQTIKDRAKATVDGAAARRAALDEQAASAMAKMNADYGANHVYELFQWVVQESADPQLVYVGNEMVAPDGTVKDRKFQNVDEPVKAILKNDMTAYPDYVRQLESGLLDT